MRNRSFLIQVMFGVFAVGACFATSQIEVLNMDFKVIPEKTTTCSSVDTCFSKLTAALQENTWYFAIIKPSKELCASAKNSRDGKLFVTGALSEEHGIFDWIGSSDQACNGATDCIFQLCTRMKFKNAKWAVLVSTGNKKRSNPHARQ